MESKEGYSFKQYAWRQFKKRRSGFLSFYIIILLAITALLSPFIANHHPLYVKIEGQSLFPAFSTLLEENKVDTLYNDNGGFTVINYAQVDWRSVNKESCWWTPVPYSPYFTDKYNRDYVGPMAAQRYKSKEGKIEAMPLRLRHFMGTDKLGRDLAAGIIHGSKVSLLVGIFAMLIAALIGIPLGATAGYFGDDGLRIKRLAFWLGLIGLLMGIFIAFVSRSYEIRYAFEQSLSDGLMSLIWSTLIAVFWPTMLGIGGHFIARGSFLQKEVNVPWDSIVSRAIEILNSLPTLILIITIAAIIDERSLSVLVVIIGLTSWTGIARFMRAEMLKIKEMEYIQTAKSLAYSNRKIIFKHALPNGLAPVFTTIAFGIASAILTESGLSFLGIGVPDDVVTWGNLLSLGQEEFQASWLVIFPGLAIFVTVTAYNLIGEALRDALDPKLKE